MGLEHRDDAPVVPRLGGGEGGADLGGVVAVVVHHEDAADFPADLEAALHAVEAGEGAGDDVEGQLEVEPHRDGGQGVEHVVAAGRLERQPDPVRGPR